MWELNSSLITDMIILLTNTSGVRNLWHLKVQQECRGPAKDFSDSSEGHRRSIGDFLSQ